MSKYVKGDLTPVVPRRFRTVFFMLVACFALWGLLNNMTDNLVPAFETIFGIKPSESAGVQISFYGAYAVLAIFAAMMVEEFSYKTGVLTGLGFYILGALIYIPACVAQSFDLYLLGIFILAGGLSILETSCNPYVLSLGPEKTAVRRLNFAQAFNPVGSLAGIFLAKYLILANLDGNSKAVQLFWVCVPYVGLIAVAAVIWLFFVRYKAPEDTSEQYEMPTQEDSMKTGLSKPAMIGLYLLCIAIPVGFLVAINMLCDSPGIWGKMVCQLLFVMVGPLAFTLIIRNYRSMLCTLLKLPRYWMGVVAQFFYVGVQIAAWTWLNKYCCKQLGLSSDVAATYYVISLILFIVCRWIATYYMKKFNPADMMELFAIIAIAACAGTMYLPSDVLFTIGGLPFSANVICLILISGGMSLMFPTIYGIALGGLDNRIVKLGAAGLIMAILGGAIITPWMGAIIESTESCWFALIPGCDATWDAALKTSDLSVRASFIVPAICFAVVLVYSLMFRKPLNKEEK